MLAAMSRGVSIRGWSLSQKSQVDAHPEIKSNPKLNAWFSRSSSRIHSDLQGVRGQLLREFNGRSLDGLDLAAIVMDGTPVGDEQLLWAIGITRDGVKVPLGVTAIPAESAQDVAAFVERLHRRGLDTSSALWIVDGHTGLRKGISIASGGRAAIQLCRVHKQRNILGALNAEQRKQHYKEISKRLRSAWAQPSHEAATAELTAFARWLDEQGLDKAAAAARHDIELTVTLQRLGIDDPVLLEKLGTTNLIESANSGVSQNKKRVKTWKEELGKSPRQGTVAVAVAGQERAWEPLVEEPSKLAEVPLAVVRSRYAAGIEWVRSTADDALEVIRLPREAHQAYPVVRDLLAFADRHGMTVTLDEYAFAHPDVAEAMLPWLEQCGFADGVRAPQPRGKMAWTRVTSPELEIRPLTVPSLAPGSDLSRALAREALGLDHVDRPLGSGPVWGGSAAALDAFGLTPGESTVEQLTAALTGRHSDGSTVRSGAPQPLPEVDGVSPGKATSVMSVAWELTAPEQVTERWLLADAAERARLEQTLVDGAQAGLRHLYGDAELATALVLDRGSAEAPALRVRGVVIGVLNDGKILSPWGERQLPRGEKLEWARADAGDLVAGMLEAELARMGPTVVLALPRALDEPWSHQDYLSVLGEQRAAELTGRADQWRDDALADVSLRELKEIHQREWHQAGDPFTQLDRAGAAEALALEQRIAGLRTAGRDGPELDALKQRLKSLRAEGRHTDRWLASHREKAFRRLALEQERAARAGAFAKDGGVVDQLESYRELLGARRLRHLTERALARTEEWAERSTEWLRARDDELPERLRPPDSSAARTLRGIERARAELERRPDRGPAVTARLAQLDRAEQGLHLGRRHPDDWLADHGAAAADRAAIRALLSERERAAGRETAPSQRAVERPLEPRRSQPARAPAGLGM